MPKIIAGMHPTGQWDPRNRVILLPDAPKFKERAPMVFAHELGHSRLEHDVGDSVLSGIVMERDAERYALNSLPPDEIDLGFLKSVWDTNLACWEGDTDDERVLGFARKARNEIMALARRKKGV